MNNNTKKSFEKRKQDNWGENKMDVDEDGVDKKGVKEIRLISRVFAVGEPKSV